MEPNTVESTTVEPNALFNEGIDRKQLARIKEKFLALNQERYARTLAGLSARQQQFLQLLPLLFHVNHPMLPGYTGQKIPIGVHEYSPTKDDLRAAKSMARSFTYARDLADKKNAIDALFIMGSLGTIAHSGISDIDVWVCHKSGIDTLERAGLQEKCNNISRWATDSIHIETHFFLMDAEHFCQGQQSVLSSEESGSAQHFLLLDEFYRTAVWLAGKLPLWWFIPAEQEMNYVAYANTLRTKRFLRAIDVIDFGGVAKIPSNEFMGAGVWQLYKGIDSPYKSVLKLLLLEVYANEQFSTPLSLDLKAKIYAAKTITHENADELDAYVLVYQRLEHYLCAKNQLTRLELVRRCFYFKAGKNLSKANLVSTKSWQHQLLLKMIQAWGWQPAQLTLLDNRTQWKAAFVQAERNLLVHELNQAYRLLIDMNKNIFNDVAINSNELLILGRKLHAEFERKAGKIDWINPSISQDLTEPALCFIQAVEDGKNVWSLYLGSQQHYALKKDELVPVKRSRNFIELLCWCYGNGLLQVSNTSTGTKLDIVSQLYSLQNSQKKLLLQTIQAWLPFPLPKTKHENFTKNAYPNKLLLLINIGVEPQAELQKKGMQMLSSQGDAFGYSGLKENLVLSADIIYTNTWGEVVCRNFSSDALVNCLLYYLRLVSATAVNRSLTSWSHNAALPQLTIRCFSVGLGGVIEQRVMDLWRAIIKCYYTNLSFHNARFIVEIADEYLLLQFFQQQPHLLRFNRYEKLLEKLSSAQMEYSPIVVDALALQEKPLGLMFGAVKAAGIYLFYKMTGKQAEVFIIDEKGSLFTQTVAVLNIPTLLRPLCRFIHSAIARQQLEQVDIAIASSTKFIANEMHIFEIVEPVKQKKLYLEPRSSTQDISKLTFINVCVVAEPVESLLSGGQVLSFTIFCDGKEFSELEFGAELFSVVASYIFSFRQHGEIYPCYITDLDLSLCRDLIAPHTGIQLIHYLLLKRELEQQLTDALHKL